MSGKAIAEPVGHWTLSHLVLCLDSYADMCTEVPLPETRRTCPPGWALR